MSDDSVAELVSDLSEVRRNYSAARQAVDGAARIERFPGGLEAAVAVVEAFEDVQDWLRAEARWRSDVKQWLAAEARFRAKTGVDSIAYQAAKAGWLRVKQYVPALDGVDRFEDLAEALQFRYAAFAAEVNGWEQPAEVRSVKQLTVGVP